MNEDQSQPRNPFLVIEFDPETKQFRWLIHDDQKMPRSGLIGMLSLVQFTLNSQELAKMVAQQQREARNQIVLPGGVPPNFRK